MSLENVITMFATACALLVVAVVLLPLWLDADGRKRED